MIQLILYGLLAAGLAFGAMKMWTGFTGQYVAEGAAAQLKADQAVIEREKAEKQSALSSKAAAEADAATLREAVDRQSLAIEEARKVAEAAQKAARAQAQLYAQERAKTAAREATLRAAAAATPKSGQSCEALLSATDAILRDSAARRVQP